MTAAVENGLLPDLLATPRPAGFESLREAAEASLANASLPTTRDEAWHYTDLKPLKALAFQAAPAAEVDIRAHILPETKGSRMVFVNGHHDAKHSCLSALPAGVRMLNLASACEAAKHLGTLAVEPDVFARLNDARFQDGACIFVPKGLRVEPVLHLLFVGAGNGVAFHPRIHVVLERGAELHLVEEHIGSGAFLSNTVVEIHVHEGASLTHERIQRQSEDSFHISSLFGKVERNARYTSRTLSFGARLSRQSPRVVLAEEGAELHLDGLALLGGQQVSDTHSFIDHTRSNGTSRQLHKAIADGEARAVFNGRIFVRPGAQATDAQQQSRNLLLSEKAQIDTKPELEIFADDVKCAHGAAIGQLDPEELFYLQSRGLNSDAARNLLTYGFAADLIDRIPVASLKRQLQQLVLERTNQ